MTPARVDNSVLQSQIDNIGSRMDKGFDELKSMLGGYDSRLRNLEQSEAGSRPVLESRIDAAWRRLDEHGTAIQDVAKGAKDELKNAMEKVDKDIKEMADKSTKAVDDVNKRAATALLIAERLESAAKWIFGIFTIILTSAIYAAITGHLVFVFK